METPRPGTEHEKLQVMVGQWTGEELIHPSPMDPVGGAANARVNNRLALSGFIVVQDYEQERAGVVNFRGHAVISYDAARKTHVMDWWDSFGMGRAAFEGGFEGSKLVLTARSPMGVSRATYDFPGDDQYSFVLEVSIDGKTWAPFLEGKYTRLV
ncbi:MAG: DUF1579 family protein [Candidatus Eisenbacteria bacterium]